MEKITDEKIAAIKTLQESNEFLERLGVKSTIEAMMENPSEEEAISKGIHEIQEHLKAYINATPGNGKKKGEAFLKSFEKNIGVAKQDIIDNVKRTLTNKFTEFLFLLDNPELPEVKELLQKSLHTEAGEKVILNIIMHLIEDLDANIFAEYVTAVYMDFAAAADINALKDFEFFIRKASDVISNSVYAVDGSKNTSAKEQADTAGNVIPLFTAKSPFSTPQ